MAYQIAFVWVLYNELQERRRDEFRDLGLMMKKQKKKLRMLDMKKNRKIKNNF
jgi:precorrin-3B methylase